MIRRRKSKSPPSVIETDHEMLHHTTAEDRFDPYGPFPVRSSHTETRVHGDSRWVYLNFRTAYAKNNWLGLSKLKFAAQIFTDHQLWRSQIHESQGRPLRPVGFDKPELSEDSVIIKNKRDGSTP